MSSSSYPLDITGTAASNLIEGERHNLTAANAAAYRLLIPEAAPFHTNNAAIVHIDEQGNRHPLQENVHYQLSLIYEAGTRGLGRPLYGAFKIIDSTLDGQVDLAYQTIGDKWVADASYVLERLAESNYNERTTIWDNLTNVQELFPPDEHRLEMDYLYGHKELIDAIAGITNQIAQGPGSVTPFALHLLNKEDPHGSIPQVLEAIRGNTEWQAAIRSVVQAVELSKLATVSHLTSTLVNTGNAGNLITLGVLLSALSVRDTDLVSILRSVLKPSKAEVDTMSNSEGMVTMTQLKQVLAKYSTKQETSSAIQQAVDSMGN